MEEKHSSVIEVYNVLRNFSDEQHPITKEDIHQRLLERGIEISDDTLTKCTMETLLGG